MIPQTSNNLLGWIRESIHEDMQDPHGRWSRQPYRKVEGLIVKVLDFLEYDNMMTGYVSFVSPRTGKVEETAYSDTTEPSLLELLAQCAD